MIFIKQASRGDYNAVVDLLSGEHLPVSDLNESLPHFFIATLDDNPVGVAGLELYGREGLLRSVAVEKNFRGQAIAKRLVEEVLRYARKNEIHELYMITTTAEKYFAKSGFSPVAREAVPAAIAGTAEFTSLCPSSATVMVTRLNND